MLNAYKSLRHLFRQQIEVLPFHYFRRTPYRLDFRFFQFLLPLLNKKKYFMKILSFNLKAKYIFMLLLAFASDCSRVELKIKSTQPMSSSRLSTCMQNFIGICSIV